MKKFFIYLFLTALNIHASYLGNIGKTLQPIPEEKFLLPSVTGLALLSNAQNPSIKTTATKKQVVDTSMLDYKNDPLLSSLCEQLFQNKKIKKIFWKTAHNHYDDLSCQHPYGPDNIPREVLDRLLINILKNDDYKKFHKAIETYYEAFDSQKEPTYSTTTRTQQPLPGPRKTQPEAVTTIIHSNTHLTPEEQSKIGALLQSSNTFLDEFTAVFLTPAQQKIARELGIDPHGPIDHETLQLINDSLLQYIPESTLYSGVD